MKECKEISLVVIACPEDEIIGLAYLKALADQSDINVFRPYKWQLNP